MRRRCGHRRRAGRHNQRPPSRRGDRPAAGARAGPSARSALARSGSASPWPPPVLAGWSGAPHRLARTCATWWSPCWSARRVAGVVPLGRYAGHRALAAPGFAAAARVRPRRDPTRRGGRRCLGSPPSWVRSRPPSPGPSTGATRRRCGSGSPSGVGGFLVTGAAALLGFPPRVAWALLLVRRAAGRAVRARLRGRRPRPLPHRPRAAGGDRVVRPRPAAPAAAGASVVAAGGGGGGRRTGHADRHGVRAWRSWPWWPVPATAAAGHGRPCPIDRVGARCLVFFCGGGLLLAGPQLPARGRPGPAARGRPRLLGRAGARRARRRSGRPAARPAPRAGAIALALRWSWSRWRPGGAGGPPGGRAGRRSPRGCAAPPRCRLVAAGVFRSLWESMHLDV